jgi:hypothetical protein
MYLCVRGICTKSGQWDVMYFCIRGSSQDSEMSCICVLGVSNTQIHDISLSWLGTDTPNTQIHDISLSWLETPKYLCVRGIKSGQWDVMYLCVRVICTSQESEMSCICVLWVSVPSKDSEMSCICVLEVSQILLTHKYMTSHCPDWVQIPHNTQIHDISLSWLDTSNTQIHAYLYQVRRVRCHVFVC